MLHQEKKSKATVHHLLCVGKKSVNSPYSISKQKDSVSKIMNAPPTSDGMLLWQRTLCCVTRRARLDTIVNTTGLFA